MRRSPAGETSSRIACKYPRPNPRSGSRWLPLPHSFQDWTQSGVAWVAVVHSVKPFPQNSSFSGIGWNWGRYSAITRAARVCRCTVVLERSDSGKVLKRITAYSMVDAPRLLPCAHRMALMICGVPRSGTTLLSRLCAAHPEIAITAETRVFAFPPASMWTHARNVSGNVIRRTWGPVRRGRRHLFRPRARVLAEYLSALASLRPRLVDTEAREAILRRMYRGVTVVGDKYPGYVFDLDTYAEDAGLSCLVVYRDGRDVASSTLHAVRTMWRGLPFTQNIDTIEKIAGRWEYGIEQMLKHKPSVHIVRYEDLVADPKTVMTAVGEWLGVDPAGFPSAQVRATSVGKFRDGLTASELEMVDHVAGPTLTKLGYC